MKKIILTLTTLFLILLANAQMHPIDRTVGKSVTVTKTSKLPKNSKQAKSPIPEKIVSQDKPVRSHRKVKNGN